MCPERACVFQRLHGLLAACLVHAFLYTELSLCFRICLHAAPVTVLPPASGSCGLLSEHDYLALLDHLPPFYVPTAHFQNKDYWPYLGQVST